ncbi:membrane protein [Arachnia rubra]|nr:membrane protein [Arachnia rubra]
MIGRMTYQQPAQPSPADQAPTGMKRLVPGLGVCLAAAGAAYGINLLLPGISPLIITIVAGMFVTNVLRLPEITSPGVDFSAKKLLRAGIIFLGLQLSLTNIAGLGAPMLLVVVCIVAGGLLGTLLLGRLLRVPPNLSLLVACGFSICGAAAVAGAAGVTDPDDRAEEDTITAVALVVIFGTSMILLVPLLVSLFGLDVVTAGKWAGGSTHEIAQVVAIGGVIGGGALAVAVVVKLARVLLLAPVIAVLSIRQRHLQRATDAPGQQTSRSKLPPIVPPFILGFLAMVLLRSFIPLPKTVLDAGSALQTVLLAAAMFALGCGVRIRSLLKVGIRPFGLAALSTLLVAAIAFLGILLVN